MINSDPMGQLGFNARRRPGSGLLAPFVWVAGLIATALAVTVGALLAVFTAAAVAMIAVVGGVLVFFAGFALRARRTMSARRRRDDDAPSWRDGRAGRNRRRRPAPRPPGRSWPRRRR